MRKPPPILRKLLHFLSKMGRFLRNLQFIHISISLLPGPLFEGLPAIDNRHFAGNLSFSRLLFICNDPSPMV